jgi:hypothetical protein
MNKPLADRITNFLCQGGLFNPEHMDYEGTLHLLIDCRIALSQSDPETDLFKRRLLLSEECRNNLFQVLLTAEKRNRRHGLVNELEREIIRLNEELTSVWKDHSMYMKAWQREIGGFIRAKHHQIDGYVLRTRDVIKEAYDRGRADGMHDSE